MLRKLGIPALVLAAAMMAVPAKAAVRFRVGIGGPVYVPAYPYYTAPYYGYSYPYAYGYWGWHHHHWRHYRYHYWR